MSKLPHAKRFDLREIDDWNVLTFTEYLKHVHEETYELPYISKNWNMERGMLKKSVGEYGRKATKDLIDESFKTHKSSPDYPGLNYWFIYSYKRKNLMPKILQKEKVRKKITETSNLSNQQMLDML